MIPPTLLQAIEPLRRRIGRFPIEIPAALMLAFATALLVLALPEWRFASAVAASGLPAVVPAAQPPLGGTARMLVALTGAAAAFAAAWAGLRALDRQATPDDFPAFRAADRHPDAPRRRPILAGAEFGAPADEPPPITEQIARRKAAPTEPLPSFLAPQPPEIGDFVPPVPAGPEPQDAAFEEEAPEAAGQAQGRWPADPFTAPVAAREPTLGREPVLPRAPRALADLSERVDEEQDGEEEQDRTDADVSQLMARLDAGLARRGGRPPSAASAPSPEQLRRALGPLR